ncbi:MAG: FecR domain-containing protein [Tannerella sp.]|nr:FecR domain-containing protein [Tannerella sp.]
MKTDKTGHEDTLEDISAEVLHVLNALKSSGCSRNINDSKEDVFRRISRKINADHSIVKEGRLRRMIRYMPAASVVLAVFISSIAFVYYWGYRSGANDVVYTEVETVVPYGTISKLTLSDGTKVVLNGGSTLTYPISFTENHRQVLLSGEGFFDVTKNESVPFIVHSAKLSVKVLGTRFSIKAYKEDKHTTLTLESGKVSALPIENKEEAIVLESDQQLIYDNKTKELQRRIVDAGNYTHWKDGILLEPNQQLIMNNKTGEINRRKVVVEDYTIWKNGILVFRNQTIGEIASILERRFNQKICILSDTIRNESYGGRFKDGEDVEEILRILSDKRDWKFSKRNGIIEITNK